MCIYIDICAQSGRGWFEGAVPRALRPVGLATVASAELGEEMFCALKALSCGPQSWVSINVGTQYTTIPFFLGAPEWGPLSPLSNSHM